MTIKMVTILLLRRKAIFKNSEKPGRTTLAFYSRKSLQKEKHLTIKWSYSSKNIQAARLSEEFSIKNKPRSEYYCTAKASSRKQSP